jgi:hypothetical protein
MTDYQIQANTRRCAATGRELRPGEKVHSVLLEAQGKFVRQDFGHEGWVGPPEGAVAHWMGKVPAQDEPRKPRIDDELLLDCFRRLEGAAEPDRVKFRYVVALLLMRRRRLKFEEVRTENGQEVLRLRDPRGRDVHPVVNPRLTDEETAAVQEEVFKVLGWE